MPGAVMEGERQGSHKPDKEVYIAVPAFPTGI